MKVLVTGGAGYVGSFAVRALVENHHEVVVVDNLSTGDRASIHSKASFIPLDLKKKSDIIECVQKIKPQAIFHFAASTVITESVAEPLKYFENNFGGTLNLLEAARLAQVENFIFSSTAAVYGQPDTSRVKESDPLKPVSPYGISKVMSEMAIKEVGRAFGMKYVILRYFNVAGASLDGKLGQRRDSPLLLRVLAQTAIGKRPMVSIYGNDFPTKDGTGVRDYIHIEDLISAHILALQYLEKGGASEIFNCGYGSGYSVREMVDMMKKVSGANIKESLEPRRPGDMPEVIADSQFIIDKLGWKPQYNNLELICKTAYDWEKSL